MFRTDNGSKIRWRPKTDITKQLMDNIINHLVSYRVYDSDTGCSYDIYRIPIRAYGSTAKKKRPGRKLIYEKENNVGHSAKFRYDSPPNYRRSYNQPLVEDQELVIVKKNYFWENSSPDILNPDVFGQSYSPFQRFTDVIRSSVVDDFKRSTDDERQEEDEELLEGMVRENSTNLEDSASVLSDDYLKMQLPQRGFPNPALSNSCWMNASLQNILRMRYFVADVLKSSANCEDRILKSFTNVVNSFINGSESLVISLRLFKNSLKEWNSEFHCPRQQDASEFFSRFLLHVLDSCASGESNNHLKESIKQNIEMTVRKRILCSSCQSVIERNDESITVFHLMVDSNEKQSVQNHFDKEMAPKNAETFSCHQCESPALQVSSIIKLPVYIILELNRPLSAENEIERKEVTLSEELNLGRWTSEETSHLPSLSLEDNIVQDIPTINENLPKGNDETYQLTGIISHLGRSPTAGHYVADVYEPTEKVWYHIDDLDVRQKSLQDDVGDSYLLIYSKISKCIMAQEQSKVA